MMLTIMVLMKTIMMLTIMMLTIMIFMKTIMMLMINTMIAIMMTFIVII